MVEVETGPSVSQMNKDVSISSLRGFVNDFNPNFWEIGNFIWKMLQHKVFFRISVIEND